MIIGDVKFSHLGLLESSIEKQPNMCDRIWFTSDTHFGHSGILKWESLSRPYDDSEEMDEDLIKRWNEKVGPDDVVFFLGDFTLGADAAQYWNQLNGKVWTCFMPHHHDKRWFKRYTRYFAEMFPVGLQDGNSILTTASGHPIMMFAEGTVIRVNLNADKKVSLTLQHLPLVEWVGSYYNGNWQLHGHTHGTYIPDYKHGFCYDVGVDSNNLCPISLAEIVERANHWESIKEKHER